jgi:hypothetical protein
LAGRSVQSIQVKADVGRLHEQEHSVSAQHRGKLAAEHRAAGELMFPQALSGTSIKGDDMPRIGNRAQSMIVQHQRWSLPKLSAVRGLVEGPACRRIEEPTPAGRLHEDCFRSGVIARREAAAGRGQMKSAIRSLLEPKHRATRGMQSEQPSLALQEIQTIADELESGQRLRRLWFEDNAHFLAVSARILIGHRSREMPDELAIVAMEARHTFFAGSEDRISVPSSPAGSER